MADRLFPECWRPEYASHVRVSLAPGSRGALQGEDGVFSRVLCLSLFSRHGLMEVLLTPADVRRLLDLISACLAPDGASLLGPAPGDVGSPVDSGFIRFRGGA